MSHGEIEQDTGHPPLTSPCTHRCHACLYPTVCVCTTHICYKHTHTHTYTYTHICTDTQAHMHTHTLHKITLKLLLCSPSSFRWRFWRVCVGVCQCVSVCVGVCRCVRAWAHRGGTRGRGSSGPRLQFQDWVSEQLQVKVSQPAIRTFSKTYVCLPVTLKLWFTARRGSDSI